jgi:excisionase family DNA binding protein
MSDNTVTDPISTTEAAHILLVSAETVRQWADTGRLPATRTGSGMRLFDRADVERLARERRATVAEGLTA